jgi:hypothetical protein
MTAVPSRPEPIRELQAALAAYLEGVSALAGVPVPGARPRAYGNYEALVLDQGRPWTSHPLDRRAGPGIPNHCYANALLLTGRFPFLAYVEGYAIPTVDGRYGPPVQHSWAVDRRGRVWDNTWPEPEHSAYFGMVFSRVEVARFIEIDEETFGILPTEYLIGAPLLTYGRLFPDPEERPV